MCTHIHSSGSLLVLFGADELWVKVFSEEVYRDLEEAVGSIRPLSTAKGRGKRNTKVNRASAIKVTDFS